MQDQFGRTIDYLRISVTDRCNLRCSYCMPEGVELTDMNELLTFEEIVHLASLAADLGIRHIKVTGGEPLVRRGTVDLIRMLKKVPGITHVTMTTNGLLLKENLPALLEAGLDGVNISLDTLDPEKYRQITGTDALETVLEAVKAACGSGIRTRINAVYLDDGDEAVRRLAGLAEDLPLDVRFIEMMPVGYGRNFPVLSSDVLKEKLKAYFPDMVPDDTRHGFGPAVYYKVPAFMGGIGFISAIHGKFCGTCNRVRLTSKGYLKCCLCYETGADLKSILRGKQVPEERDSMLKDVMRKTIYKKPQAHCFEQPDSMTEKLPMSRIGG